MRFFKARNLPFSFFFFKSDGKPLQDFHLRNRVIFLKDPLDAFGDYYGGQEWKKREDLGDYFSCPGESRRWFRLGGNHMPNG